MDQASYWMWSRRQWSGGPPVNFLPSTAPAGYPYYESWEERAFAEDSAGLLGAGCVWPPRSYSCSFCRREFRSAQALGGHMNVHRRDRARLKQSSSSDRENNDYEHRLNPQVTTLVLPNPNPNTNPNPSNAHVASNLSSPSKNSAVSAHDCSENTLLSASCSSNIIQERLKEPLFSTTGTRLEPILIRELDDLDLKLGGMTRKAMEACSHESENRGGEDDEANRSKRRRTSMLLPSQMVPTCTSRNQQEVQSELLQPFGEMDLELRLGYGPKI